MKAWPLKAKLFATVLGITRLRVEAITLSFFRDEKVSILFRTKQRHKKRGASSSFFIVLNQRLQSEALGVT